MATGFDRRLPEHPAAFLPPPPPAWLRTAAHWLHIWMEKDGRLLKKASAIRIPPKRVATRAGVCEGWGGVVSHLFWMQK